MGDGKFDGPLFGTREQVGMVRGLAEFRARRPVLIAANSEKHDELLLTLPIDGIDSGRLAAFKELCSPHRPKLLLSARRARTLGIETNVPMAVTLAPGVNAETLLELVADPNFDRALDAQPAGACAVAAIQVAKLAQGLPAVLAAKPNSKKIATFDPPLVTVTTTAVAQYRADMIRSLRMTCEAPIPLDTGTRTRFVAFCDALGENSVAIIVGEPDFEVPVPVRLHSACLTGDVFGSRRCDCGDQLKLSIKRLDEIGGGIILYLAQEGRGLGLANKLRTYQLQDVGLDTVDANTTLGFDDDERDYGVAARMLEILGCRRIVLLTNNPAKLDGLTKAGIEITERMPIEAPITADNARYLTAKAVRAGHKLEHLVVSLAESPNAVARVAEFAR
jgi:GTP cyclohydrolase II